MTTAVQVQYRRGTSTQVAAFTGAAGEMVIDTTNNRVVVQDGATAGGWPADLSVRTAVTNAGYAAKVTDRIIAYTSISAAQTVSLPASSSFPTGTVLKIVDESGSCSGTNTIAVNPNGSDTINGGTSATIQSAYGFIQLESSGAGKWTILAASNGVTLTSPVITGGSINNTPIGQTTAAAGSFTALSASGTVSGSGFSSYLASPPAIGTTAPAAGSFTTLSLTRHAVSDANYTVASGISSVAYTAITAARTVSLPASSSFSAGQQLLVVDESGACSATKTITLSPNGSDKIDGASSAVINAPYGYVAIESNASGNWTIVDQGPQVLALNGLTGDVTLAATDGAVISASGSTVSIGGPGGMVNKFRNGTMDVWQRGTSPSLTAGTSGSQYTADGWQVNWTASSSAAPSISQASGRLLTKSSLEVTGASNITDVQVQQRIESLIAATLCSQTVTVQAQVYNNTGAAITPTLTVKHAGSQDNWSSPTTDVSAVNLQSCANGAWTLVAYTFGANAASYNGLEVIFDFGNNLGSSSKDIQITEVDIRVTPGAATGLNSSPPPPELRPIATELTFCQRYFENLGTGAMGVVASSSTVWLFYRYAAPKRATPTLAILNTAPTIITNAGSFTGSSSAVSADYADTQGVTASINGFSGLTANNFATSTTGGNLFSASAEL